MHAKLLPGSLGMHAEAEACQQFLKNSLSFLMIVYTVLIGHDQGEALALPPSPAQGPW